MTQGQASGERHASSRAVFDGLAENSLDDIKEEVRDDEGVIASTCAPQMLFALRVRENHANRRAFTELTFGFNSTAMELGDVLHNR